MKFIMGLSLKNNTSIISNCYLFGSKFFQFLIGFFHFSYIVQHNFLALEYDLHIFKPLIFITGAI